MRSSSKIKPIVAVLQARMGSTRLPGKVLMPLAGEPMLARIIQRVSTSLFLDHLVVATTDQPSDDPIVELCQDLGVSFYRGSEKDVLGRYLGVAIATNAAIIVRLTGDNPMVDGSLVDFVINRFLCTSGKIVYASNIDEAGFPFGLYVEVIEANALKSAGKVRSDENCEHVTWYIRKNPGIYPTLTVEAPGRFSTESLSVDTAQDYARVSGIFEKLFSSKTNFTFRDLMI